MNMKLRRARPDDAHALARAHVTAFHVAYQGVVPYSYMRAFTVELGTARFRRSLARNSEKTYLVEQNNDVLGFITLGACRDPDIDPNTTGEIWGIYLHPKYWRNGIGRFISRQGEYMLASQGYTEVTLWVFEDNGPARRFYEAMGFKADGAAKDMNFGAAIRTVRYRKKLKDVRRKDHIGDL